MYELAACVFSTQDHHIHVQFVVRACSDRRIRFVIPGALVYETLLKQLANETAQIKLLKELISVAAVQFRNAKKSGVNLQLQ